MKKFDEQLLEAAKNGDTPACRDLLARGANVHALDEWGQSTLNLAARYGRTDTCQFLLECGIDANAVDQWGRNALHLTAWKGYIATCLILLEHDCSPLAKTKDGETALDLAIQQGYENCTQVMRAWIIADAARAALQEVAANTLSKVVAP